MSQSRDTGSFFLGFLVGGLTGAIAALLLAPQSGEETRTAIRDKAIELTDQGTESARSLYGQAEAAAQQAIKRAQDTLNLARKRVEETLQEEQVVLEEQERGSKKE